MSESAYAFHVRHRDGWATGFGPRPTHCHRCDRPLPRDSDGCGTGYGCGTAEPIPAHVDAPALKKGESLERSPAYCYACCAELDKADMRETGRAVLYLSKRGDAWQVTNWPGSLSIRPDYVQTGRRNNFGAQRTDAWFTFEGTRWHGVVLGDSQILRCKRLKGTK